MTKRTNENQIVKILDEAKTGAMTIEELCRKHGISTATYYNWKDKYAGMALADIKRLKQLEDENRRLKQMFANQSLEIAMLKDIIEKKL
jgi:putative transposase